MVHAMEQEVHAMERMEQHMVQHMVQHMGHMELQVVRGRQLHIHHIQDRELLVCLVSFRHHR